MKDELIHAGQIMEMVDQLYLRIKERFPKSDVLEVCQKLDKAAKETNRTISWIESPNMFFRIGMGVIISVVLLMLPYGLSTMKFASKTISVTEVVQVSEAALNALLLFGAAIFSLVSIENRSKRRKVIKAINRLRSIAHAVDAHQLTKVPGSIAGKSNRRSTKSSPKRTMTSFELGRYLNYCSEMLSITGKVGFLYVQNYNDPVSVEAVNDLESLTTGLSRKIWQKLMILRTEQPTEAQQPGMEPRGTGGNNHGTGKGGSPILSDGHMNNDSQRIGGDTQNVGKDSPPPTLPEMETRTRISPDKKGSLKGYSSGIFDKKTFDERKRIKKIENKK
ncbi:MAG: hypothetical protein GY765_37455 [bacterium]|nr:hypothetical protein [bacterium]